MKKFLVLFLVLTYACGQESKPVEEEIPVEEKEVVEEPRFDGSSPEAFEASLDKIRPIWEGSASENVDDRLSEIALLLQGKEPSTSYNFNTKEFREFCDGKTLQEFQKSTMDSLQVIRTNKRLNNSQKSNSH